MRIKTHLKLWGVVGMVSGYTLMVVTFIVAYMSPDKTVLVAINNYGEGNIELILNIILYPIALYTAYRVVIDEAKSISYK